MNQQPTVILLKFTDFLNNRDSLAFLRLSHSVWLSHRSPSGRLRLKAGHGSGFQFSLIPTSYFSGHLRKVGDFSPVGNYFLDSLVLAKLEDFRRFKEISRPAEDEKRQTDNGRFLEGLKILSIHQLSHSVGLEISQLPRNLEEFHISYKLEKIIPQTENPMRIKIQSTKIKTMNLINLSIGEEAYMDFLSHPLIQRQEQLEILRMPQSFNSPIESTSLPSTLKELEFGAGFSSPILALPPALEILRFSHRSSFNHPLPPLPSSLRAIELGDSYNEMILPGQLPAGLKILKFGDYFDMKIEQGVFPPGLEELAFGSSFDQPLTAGILPASLKRFTFYLKNSFSSSLVLPESLEFLDISFEEDFPCPMPRLPAALKELQLEGFNSPIESIDFFPPRLRVIDFGYSFDSVLRPGIFPSTVEEINLPAFNHPLELSVFPSGLKKISFGALDQPLPLGIFPDGLDDISLGRLYKNQLKVGLFPKSVRKLAIATKSPLLPGIFPEGVESIWFLNEFVDDLVPGIFPFSLRQLRFWQNNNFSTFQQEIRPGLLPPLLSVLDLGLCYAGHCLLSSLPAYFHPDLVSSEKIFCRLNPAYRAISQTFIERYGQKEFLMNSLRVSIGPQKDSYVIISSVSGEFPPFIVNNLFISKIPNR